MIKRFPFRQWDCLPLMHCYLDRLGAPDVSRVAKLLLEYCKEHGWPCDIGIAAISKALKITQRQVENAMEDMKEFGIADVDGYTNTLTFNWRGLRNMEARERRLSGVRHDRPFDNRGRAFSSEQ
jgi:hypothetical protein